MSGARGMQGAAFYYTCKNDYKITCSDKDVNEQWLNYLNFTNTVSNTTQLWTFDEVSDIASPVNYSDNYNKLQTNNVLMQVIGIVQMTIQARFYLKLFL